MLPNKISQLQEQSFKNPTKKISEDVVSVSLRPCSPRHGLGGPSLATLMARRPAQTCGGRTGEVHSLQGPQVPS